MRRPPRVRGPGPGKRDRRFRDEKRVGNREIHEICEREDQAGRRLRRATRGQPPATPDGANGSAHTEARSHEVKTNRHPSDPCGFVAWCEVPFPPGVPLRLLDLQTCPCHAPPVRLQYLPRDTEDERQTSRCSKRAAECAECKVSAMDVRIERTTGSGKAEIGDCPRYPWLSPSPLSRIICPANFGCRRILAVPIRSQSIGIRT